MKIVNNIFFSLLARLTYSDPQYFESANLTEKRKIP